MKVSIALATYNGEEFLCEQLESFTKQTILPDEVVIVDDGSTDYTLDIVDTFKKTAPFKVEVYSNKINLGYTQNFNKALQLCTNELIFLSDQDDVWFPEKIEYVKELANTYLDKEVFFTNAELADSKLQTNGLTTQGQTKSLGLDKHNLVIGCCIAVRKRFLDIIMPIPKDFQGHDSWIALLADFFNLRMIDDTVLQLYRRHDSNASNETFSKLDVQKEYFLSKIINKIIRLVKDSKIDILLNSIKRQKLLLNGIYNLNSHIKYQNNEINIKIEEMGSRVKKLNKRLEILTTKKIRLRLKKAWQLHKSFGYSLKHFMSDFIFH